MVKKLRNILFVISFIFISSDIFAKELSIRFLDKANEVFEEDNIEDAYKYINQALEISTIDSEAAQTNVIIFAQQVYKVKLQKLQKNYDEMALADIKINLEKYPNIENTTIKKLVKQIENMNLSEAANTMSENNSSTESLNESNFSSSLFSGEFKAGNELTIYKTGTDGEEYNGYLFPENYSPKYVDTKVICSKIAPYLDEYVELVITINEPAGDKISSGTKTTNLSYYVKTGDDFILRFRDINHLYFGFGGKSCLLKFKITSAKPNIIKYEVEKY